MTYLEDVQPQPPSWLETGFVWYLRLLALCFIGFTVLYWLRVSGYYPGNDWRFDTMSTPWKIASAVLSVLLPVTAVGLWSALAWGQVVWTMAIATELLMFSWFSNYFGSNQIIVIFHIVSIIIYLILRGAMLYSQKNVNAHP